MINIINVGLGLGLGMTILGASTLVLVRKDIKNMLNKDSNDKEANQVIAKVWHAKANNNDFITIPKRSGIKTGDYVKIEVLSRAPVIPETLEDVVKINKSRRESNRVKGVKASM
jgi:hypothetical protein